MMVNRYKISLADLLAQKKLEVDEPLTLKYKGMMHEGSITREGQIAVGNKVYPTPSGSARAVMEVKAIDGWKAWRVPRLDGVELGSVREGATPSAPVHSRVASGSAQARLDRLDAMKAEGEAVKAWQEGGEVGEKPATPLTDEADAKRIAAEASPKREVTPRPKVTRSARKAS